MSDELPVFDNTVQKTNELLNMLADSFGWTDKHHAYLALRAVLHALRDRLPVEAAVALGAQLPMLVRGFYYESWRPSETPVKMKKEEFLEAVLGELVIPFKQNSELIVGGVFKTLYNFLDPGEMEKVKKLLPKDIAGLVA